MCLQNNPTPRKHMIETMPGGVAAFDYNNDGRADIFFTNGAAIPSLEKDSPKYFNRLLSERWRHEIHGRYVRSRPGGRGLLDGRGRGRLQQRRPHGSVSWPASTGTFSIGTLATGNSKTSLRNRALRVTNGPSLRGGSTTITTAGSICSLSITRIGHPTLTVIAANAIAICACTVIPNILKVCPIRFIAIAAMGLSRTLPNRLASLRTSDVA